MQLFMDVLLRPRFDEDRLAKAKDDLATMEAGPDPLDAAQAQTKNTNMEGMLCFRQKDAARNLLSLQ